MITNITSTIGENWLLVQTKAALLESFPISKHLADTTAMPSSTELPDNGLPKINRVITTHNDDKKAVYSSKFDDALPWQELADGARFCLGYATDKTPVPMNNGADLDTYHNFLENKPGIAIPGGAVCRLVDMQPGALSPMHRTVSLDFGVVLEGEVELVLDSGEAKTLRRGDVAVQRGTNHAWRNVTPDGKWARMIYVLIEAEPLVVAGQPLDEDYGGIPGVKASRAH